MEIHADFQGKHITGCNRGEPKFVSIYVAGEPQMLNRFMGLCKNTVYKIYNTVQTLQVNFPLSIMHGSYTVKRCNLLFFSALLYMPNSYTDRIQYVPGQCICVYSE